MEEFMEQYGNVMVGIIAVTIMAGSFLQGGIHGMSDVIFHFINGLLV